MPLSKSTDYGNNAFSYTYDVNGKTYTLDFNKLGYKAENLFRQGQKKHVASAVELTLKLGHVPTEKEYTDYLDQNGISGGRNAYNVVKQDVYTFLRQNNIDYGTDGTLAGFTSDMQVSGTPDGQASAFNAYYDDLYSMKDGTGGKEMYDQLAGMYEHQAQAQGVVADAQYQAQAMQQAATIKAITDQVRSERMARLKAGMSESQIANQDMQMMMTNVNTLNQNAALMNQARLEAQANMYTAKDQAYADYLNQANARGTVATGMYAADSGNAYWQTVQKMITKYGNDPTKWTSSQWDTENQTSVQGYPTE